MKVNRSPEAALAKPQPCASQQPAVLRKAGVIYDPKEGYSFVTFRVTAES